MFLIINHNTLVYYFRYENSYKLKKIYKLNSKFSLQNLLTSAILRIQVWHATLLFVKAIAWTSWPFVNEFSKKKN